MCRPPIARGSAVYNVDLKLDALVEPDGETFALIDEDEFAEAQTAGWLTDVEVAGARFGADELTGIIRDGGLRPFLSESCPLIPSSTLCQQDPPGTSVPKMFHGSGLSSSSGCGPTSVRMDQGE